MKSVERDGWVFEVNPEIQQQYYKGIEQCDCDYCQNYREQIKEAYPELCEFLGELGVDPCQMTECSSFTNEETESVDYFWVQYVVCGRVVDSVPYEIDIGSTSIVVKSGNDTFTLDIYGITLPDQKGIIAEEREEEEKQKIQKKKTRKKVITVLLVVGFAVLVWLDLAHTGTVVSATANFEYIDISVSDQLSNDETKLLMSAIRLHPTYKDSPSCSFDEDNAVVVTNNKGETMTFCFACDDCSNIYWKEKDRYIGVSSHKYDKVRDMLRDHGFVWPCV